MIRARHLLLLAPLALAACSGGESPLQGYVEGTYVYIAADSAGRIVERPASAGTRVAAGDVVFILDDAEQREAVAGAEARLAQAEADLANLRTGQRPEELSVLAANLSAAEASLRTAEEDLARKQALLDRGVVARSVVDDAAAARDTAQAHVDAARQQMSVAALPARPEQIAAAERNVAAQAAALAQSRIQLDRRRVTAPAAGLVTATTFETGEQVPAGQPVVTLLPDANRKVRFYVPETGLARLAIGDAVAVSCDNCAAGLTASIDFISASAEFTPPVIFSRDSREKLVFRVEAQPVGEALALNVGQPLDVRLGAPR